MSQIPSNLLVSVFCRPLAFKHYLVLSSDLLFSLVCMFNQSNYSGLNWCNILSVKFVFLCVIVFVLGRVYNQVLSDFHIGVI